ERLREIERIVDNPGARAKRAGLAAFGADRLDEAGARLEEAIRYSPRDAQAAGMLGVVRLREQRHAEALALFEQAAREDAPGRANWERLARTAAYWARVAEAREARESGRLDEAEARAREAMALDPAEGQAGAELARILEARAKAERSAGHAEAAIAAYEAAAALSVRDPWMRLELARLYAARGDAGRGEALFRALDASDPDASFAFAIYLSGIGRESDALVALERIPVPRRTAQMTGLQRGLWRSVQSRRMRMLEEAGRDAEAAAVLEEMRAAATGDAPLAEEVARADATAAMRRARALRAAGRGAEAAAIYRERVAADPSDREARLALIDSLLDAGETSEAHAVLAPAVAASPDDPRVLSQAGRLALAEGRLADAVDFEQRAMVLAPREDEGWRYQRVAGLIDRQLSWVGVGAEALHRAGTAGKSQLDSGEIPVGARQGWTAQGEWFVHATPSRIASGELDRSNTYELSRFGTELLCLAPCAALPVSSVEKGLALGAGYERGAWRIDLGTSPLGFPVVNAVGSIATRGDWGPVGYTIEAARRPVASSLLSYAGVRDPNTGRTWGGVVSSGVRANLSRDSGGDYGAWSVLGLYSLTGRNVRANGQAELMAGGYRRLVNETDRQLTAGLTAMLWRFRDNAGEFTFGHGGYYSPRWYRSLALPVSFGMRDDLTSFAVRASVSVSWATTDRAPFFPTDPALQAEALALAPTTGVDPFYPGGTSGRSFGRAFEAAIERQVGSGTFVGARLDIERSTNYTPSRFLLYVRFTPGGAAARPVALPPEPGIPGARY
ncbi:MAG TPA: cellulose synthase subunit BcsC-related outer membrane protein, partial [Usitatibacter sp.]|nr:cellulose synthase subunit BcsC-related outer membrane protein [Usitatibacter sp.]